MIINSSISPPIRSAGAVLPGAADTRAPHAVAPDSRPGRQLIPLITREQPPGEVTTRTRAPGAPTERIDLRVLNAAPVSHSGRQAIDAYQTTAQLGDGGKAVVAGMDELA